MKNNGIVGHNNSGMLRIPGLLQLGCDLYKFYVIANEVASNISEFEFQNNHLLIKTVLFYLFVVVFNF